LLRMLNGYPSSLAKTLAFQIGFDCTDLSTALSQAGNEAECSFSYISGDDSEVILIIF
jgi:hypothetical protein